MRRRCAWCEITLAADSNAWSPTSEALCRECFGELRGALAANGLCVGGTPEASNRGMGAHALSPMSVPTNRTLVGGPSG